jgi:prepilin-type processing-associated H-X9-DG protein/prepilin-type N-terminal cleavage/methylation domain-containing protein
MAPQHPRRVGTGAFTLIELLVVISIIVVLASMLLPAISTARSMAERTRCASNVRQLGIGLVGYRADFEDLLPPTCWNYQYLGWVYGWPKVQGRWQHFLEPYIGTYKVFNCPVSVRRMPTFEIKDKQDTWIPRGWASAGAVCTMAYNSSNWGRLPDASTYPGPMNDAKMQAQIAAVQPGSDSNRCPVLFDGAWHNNQWPTTTDQQRNLWGVYFPHRLKTNMAFADGHVETKAFSDFTTFMPVIQVRE